MATAKKLPSGSWRVQAKATINGEKIVRSFTDTTAKKAEKAAEEWQRHLKILGSDFTRMTVKEAIKFYITNNNLKLSPSTIKEYDRISKNDMQDIIDKPLYSLTCPIIESSMNKALSTLSPKTIKNRYGLLRRILNVYHPTFVWNIEYPKQRKKEKRVYSNKYIGEILKAIKGNPFEVEVYLGILSMRESEIGGSKWTDINYTLKTLHVCRAKLLNKNNEYVIVDNTKTFESDRIVYLPDYVCNLLRERQRQSKSEFITEVPTHAFWDRLNYILKKNNLEPLSFHGLRHIYSSLSSSLGIDAQIRMQNGGWSSEKIMDGNYRHAISEAQEDANKKMNTFINNMIKSHTKSHTHYCKRLKLVRYGL